MTGGGRPRTVVASVIKRLHVGGDETRLLMLARHLDRSRFEHVLIVVNDTAEERNAGAQRLLDLYAAAGTEVIEFGLEVKSGARGSRRWTATPLDLVDGVRSFVRLVALLRRRGVHVLDARLEFATVVGTLAARVARVPVVVATGYSPEYWDRPFLRLPGQAAVAAVDALVSDAQITLDDYEAWRRVHRARLVLIPNGVDAALPTRPRAEICERLGLPTDPEVRIVGQVGRLIPRKNHELFLRVAAEVADRHPGTRFLVCGLTEDDSYVAQLVGLGADLGLGDRVSITSYRGPIGDVLSVLDVFAHLSSSDSSPMAVLESMSAGLPAVVTDVGGTAELVEDGVTGLLVRSGDQAAAAMAFERLLVDRDLARRLASAARERYEQFHRPEQMARAHEQLFGELLEGAAR